MAEVKESRETRPSGVRRVGDPLETAGWTPPVHPIFLGIGAAGVLLGFGAASDRWGIVLAVAAVLAAITLVGWYVRTFFLTRRRRADFFSGYAERALRAAEEEVDLGQVPRNYRVLTLAAVGDFAGARRALLAGVGNQDWGCQELGLCARILIESFEGNPRRALALCRDLLDEATLYDRRSMVRRESVIAIARIAAGVGDDDDLLEVGRAPTFEPALLWACRYATILPQRGASLSSYPIFRSAPRWPRESYFYWLQQRLTVQTRGRRQALSLA